MQVITACVPSARICPHLCAAFRRLGIHAEASARPFEKSAPHEHLPCPIEPAEKHYIHIAIYDQTPIEKFLEATFLSIEFITSLLAKINSENDLLTIECITTAASARRVALAFIAKKAPHQLIKAAVSEGNKPERKQLAEHVLGIPNLATLLVEYADVLIAGPTASYQPCLRAT